MSRTNFGVIIFLLIIGVVAFFYFSSQNKTDEWDAIKAQDIAIVSSEWSTPINVPLNSAGWEDGAYISNDGNTLYFTYINYDLFNNKVIGIDRDTQGLCSPHCGVYPRADVFYSVNNAVAKPYSLSIPYPIGGLVLDGDTAYYHKHSDTTLTDIYSNINGNEVKIETVNSQYRDDDPFVKGDAMFFWSDRPSTLEGNNIFFSQRVDGIFQTPVMLPEPINSNANDMQPFAYANSLYFSSDRDGSLKIYKTSLVSGNWTTPTIVIQSKYGVGEPTLPDDGSKLYFVQFFKNTAGVNNPDMMYVTRK